MLSVRSKRHLLRVLLGGALVVAVILISNAPLVAEGQKKSIDDYLEPCATGEAVDDASENPGPVYDCAVLLYIRDTYVTVGEVNWNPELPMNRWDGITISSYEENRVLHFRMDVDPCINAIPSELGLLPKIRLIELSHCPLSGGIPPELGNAASLIKLGIYSFPPPTRFFPGVVGQITHVDGTGSPSERLSGVIPAEIGQLTNLRQLEIFNQDIVGPLPAELGNLSGLHELHLSGNLIEGPFPPELFNLSSLSELSLADNLISGPIPPQIGQLSSLSQLRLQKNQFTGGIPIEITDIGRLQELNLSDNRVSGPIPPEIRRLLRLETLRLSNNNLTGTIPALPQGLTRVWLSGNNFTGCIPSLPNLRLWSGDLDKLGLPECSPDEEPSFSDPPDVQCAILVEAYGPRRVPALVRDCTALLTIKEKLNGSESLNWSGIVPMRGWDGVEMDGYYSSDATPEDPGVSGLYLSDIGLSGDFPIEISHLKELTALILSDNSLTGIIPAEIGNLQYLRYVDLSGNRLSGPIPDSMGDLQELNSLNLASNRLSGEIPESLGNLSEVWTLLLSNNQFTGPIPPQLADSLRNLYELNLSNNSLEDCIPIGLARSPSEAFADSGAHFCFAVDDVPMDGLLEINPGGTLEIDPEMLTANDLSTSNGRPVLIQVGEATHGEVSLDRNIIRYTHDGSRTARDSFRYTVSDGVHTAEATVHIRILLINEAPRPGDDTIRVSHGESISVPLATLLQNDSDADDDPLMILEVSGAASGQVSLSNRNATYRHDGSQSTGDSFSYVVTDGIDQAIGNVEVRIQVPQTSALTLAATTTVTAPIEATSTGRDSSNQNAASTDSDNATTSSAVLFLTGAALAVLIFAFLIFAVVIQRNRQET